MNPSQTRLLFIHFVVMRIIFFTFAVASINVLGTETISNQLNNFTNTSFVQFLCDRHFII